MSAIESIPNPVVIRFPTIMDGAVLRWYWSIEDAEKGTELCSASRNGVFEDANEICPMEWLDEAHKAHDLLAKRGNDADTSLWETHTKGLFGPVTELGRDIDTEKGT